MLPVKAAESISPPLFKMSFSTIYILKSTDYGKLIESVIYFSYNNDKRRGHHAS